MPVLDVIQAVQTATDYFSKLMTVNDIRLEEVELPSDEHVWHVTLSGLVAAQRSAPPGPLEGELANSTLADLFRHPQERVYKVFTIDSGTGSVQSMKIRKVE